MKSKISFFNKAMLRKNISLYWPIWGIYLVVLLLMIPVRLWFGFRTEPYIMEGMNGSVVVEPWSSVQLRVVGDCLNLTNSMVVVFIMAVISGMALYNYLFVAKNANMIHALPVTRGELFGTNLISGLLFMFIPQILAFIGGVLVCLGNGATCVEYLGIWLLVMMGVSFLSYSMVVFCAMFTGQMSALPVYYVVLNFLYLMIRTVISTMVSFFGYGIDYYTVVNSVHLEWLSPMYYLFRLVYFSRTYSSSMICEEIRLYGGHIVAMYMIFAVILLIFAYQCYKRRHLEQAGDLLTVGFVKPIFRWGCGFSLGYLGSMWIEMMLWQTGIYISKGVLLVCVAVIGVICFALAEMLVQKNFRIIKKRTLIECGMFLVFLVITFFAMEIGAYCMENRIPQREEIASVSVEMNYPIVYKDSGIDEVLDIHREILSHKKEFKKYAQDGEDGNYIEIVYRLKDGSRITRCYMVPLNPEGEEVFNQIYEKEIDTDAFLRYQLGEDYEQMNYTGGWLELTDEDYNYYESVEFGKEEAAILLEAVIADVNDGVLQKYNTGDVHGVWKSYDTSYTSTLAFSSMNRSDPAKAYEVKDQVSFWYESYYFEEDFSAYNFISFGSDCRHIINALVDTGVIRSEDELTLIDPDGDYY